LQDQPHPNARDRLDRIVVLADAGQNLIELAAQPLARDYAGKRRAFAAVRQLKPWRNEPFVQAVQDRLLALAS
jgi:hypothetical protein